MTRSMMVGVHESISEYRVARHGEFLAVHNGLRICSQAPDKEGAPGCMQALLTGPGGRSSNMTALAASSWASSCSFSAMASAAPACTRQNWIPVPPSRHSHSCELHSCVFESHLIDSTLWSWVMHHNNQGAHKLNLSSTRASYVG